MPRRTPGLAALVLLLSAVHGSADFLILKNGRAFQGKVERTAGGGYHTPESRYSYRSDQVARTSTAKSVEEVIRTWSAEIEAEKMRDPAQSALWLARFCIFERRYRDAKRFLEVWAKDQGDWKVTQSKFFFILSDAKKKRVAEVRVRLDKIMERFQKDFKTERKLQRDFVVRLFRDEYGFDAYAREHGVTGAAAYYSASERELVLWDMSMINKNFTFESVFHEANHQYMDQYYFDHDLKHPWFYEGLATYYESARFKRGKIVDVGRKNRTYLLDVKKAMKEGRLRPLEGFLRLPTGRFSAGTAGDVDYGEAWALVYFFRETRDREWKKRFDDYVAILRKTGNDDKALKTAIPAEKIAALQEAFLEFVERL